MSGHVFEVIVVGAGVSGLSGAKVLADKGVDVLVLEARDRVGGRTWTVENSNVGWIDLGGAYVGRSQNHLLRLIKEFNLKLYPVHETQKLVYYDAVTGRRSLFNNDQTPNLGFLALLDLNHVLRLIDRLGKEIPADAPWTAPRAEEWDKMTFKEFVEANTITREAREFMRIFITLLVTNESYQSSLLWFLWYVKQCGGSKPIFSTTNGGQEFKVNGGTNQITHRLADCVGKDRVRLSQPVYYIEQSDSEVLVRTLNGGAYRCRYLIMATPPAVQQKIHYSPPLPAMRNQLIQRAPQGSVYKCILYYERTFWREANMCGSVLMVGDDYEIPINYALDDCKPDGSKPAIVGFLPADKARKLSPLTKEERCKLICESYARAFDCDEARKPIHYEEQNWMAEQYSGGCYTMTLAPGFLTRYGPYLREPIGQMHFAGTECAVEWSGYINGGIQAGERTAREVMAKLGRIAANKVDQVEPVSLDYPPVPFESTIFERYAPSAKSFLYGLALVSVTASAATGTVYFAKCKDVLHTVADLWQHFTKQ